MTRRQFHSHVSQLFRGYVLDQDSAFPVSKEDDPEDPASDKLALFTSPSCAFCWRVSEVINRLGLEVEMRNVFKDQATREELLKARGRMTVPVLRIQSPEGEVLWMPESIDIIHYLEHTYG